MTQVLVIGAGVIGASIGFHLAKRGADVTILDAETESATANSFGWINSAHSNDDAYHALRMMSMAEYPHLEHEIEALVPDKAFALKWGGTLNWDQDHADLDDVYARQVKRGYPVRWVNAEQIADIEPALTRVPERALYSEYEAVVDPVVLRDALLAGAEKLGASIKHPCTVLAFLRRDGQIVGVESDEGAIEAEHVVLAVGGATEALLRELDVRLPIRREPGLLIHTKPLTPLINAVWESPGLHVKQDLDGRIVAGQDYGGSPLPNDQEAEANRLIAKLKNLTGADAELDQITIGYRPIPDDGLPAVGRYPHAPGLTVATMHSGITLAPVIGRLVATELLDGVTCDPLRPFWPDRF